MSEPLKEAVVFHVGAPPLELSCRVERAPELTYSLWYHNSCSLLGLTGTACVLVCPASTRAPAAGCTGGTERLLSNA